MEELMSAKFDPVLVELMRHEFIALSEEMNMAMRQSARSLVAKEASELSTALLTADGKVIGQATVYGLGYFTAAMPFILDKFAGQFRPGDVFLTNDPYGGASHLPDIVLVKPLFWRGELCGFAAAVEHHTDIGGRYPGGMGPGSPDIFHEGLRLPAVRYCENDRPISAVREIIAANVRTPDDVLGDLDAAVATCRRGEQGLFRLLEKYGRETVENGCRALYDLAEQTMRKTLRIIPDGTYRAEADWSDGAGINVKLCLALTARDGGVLLDLAGSSPQVPKAYNVPPLMVDHILADKFLFLLGDEDAPINSGLFAPIAVNAPKGSVFNPEFPAAVASRGTLIFPISDLLFRALAQALPQRMPASWEGGSSSITYAPVRQSDRTGILTDIYGSGQGGRPDGDAVDGSMPYHLSMYLSAPTEVIERELPIMLEGCGYVPDTGGPGRHRGSLAVYRSYRFLADGDLLFRTVTPGADPYGLAGGGDGTPGEAFLIRDGKRIDLPRVSVNELRVKAGDVFYQRQRGAGGYGNPFEREPSKVLDDVLNDKISAAYAEREYGVAIDTALGRVDEVRTAALRSKRAA
jgi:N-methylhydantoinase B